jgi:hypothetical protein
MKKMSRVLALVTAALLVPALGWAASPWTEKTTYADKVIGKFEFGVKNLLGGWTELVSEPMDHYKEEKTMKHFLMGVKTGICHSVLFSVGGALHLATFPITQIDITVPHNGVDF